MEIIKSIDWTNEAPQPTLHTVVANPLKFTETIMLGIGQIGTSTQLTAHSPTPDS